jgi:hypothetical protein
MIGERRQRPATISQEALEAELLSPQPRSKGNKS